MIARDVMSSPVITVQESASVKDVAALLLAKHISGVVVTKHDVNRSGFAGGHLV